MIALPPGTKVFLACQPIDLRAGFDGLAAKAQQIIGADPFSDHVSIFRSKRGHYLKGLYWDGSGLCLFAKRLERNKFVWPPIVDGTLTLTPAQLALLIEAMDWRRTIAPPAPPRPMLVSCSSLASVRRVQLWRDGAGGQCMIVVYLCGRLMACCDPLGAQREDHQDHIHVDDGTGMSHRTGTEQRLVRRDIGTGRARQERDQASSNRPGILMNRWPVR
jgi:transposase